MELHAKYTLFAEGCRGHLGKELIAHFGLDESGPQHYGIGIKEVWQIKPELHEEGKVTDWAGHCQRAVPPVVPSCITQRITRFT